MKKSGFTLLEVVIVMALTCVILGILYSIFQAGNKVFSDADVRATLQMEARNVQEELTNLGIQAADVTGVKIGSSYSDSDNKAYVEQKYSDLSSKNINEIKILGYGKDSDYAIDHDSGEYKISNPLTYYVKFENDTLSMITETEAGTRSEKVIAKHIISFNVEPEDTNDIFANASSIKFNIVLRSQKAFSDVPDYTISVKVTFRNKKIN